MAGCLWKINEPVQLGATPFRAIKLARGSKFFEAAHALLSCTEGEKESEKEIVACCTAMHTREVLCARRGFRYSGASAARKKPKHYRYWWPSCRTDRVDLSARRKEIFLWSALERGGDRTTENRRWYAKAEIYDNICRDRTSREMKFPRYGSHFSRRDLFPDREFHGSRDRR